MPVASSTRHPEKQYSHPRFIPARPSQGPSPAAPPDSSPQKAGPAAAAPAASKPKLLDQVRAAIRLRHYSLRTEDTYLHWIKRFIFFHGKRHPAEMGAQEIGQFLSALAVEHHVSASTQNQALNALVFLYRYVLARPPSSIDTLVRAKQSQSIRAPAYDAAITCTKSCCNAQCAPPPDRPASSSPWVPTRCAIRLRPTC
jgi:Phage integrase, N-terminal SAM-like domain